MGIYADQSSGKNRRVTAFLLDFLGNASALGVDVFAVTHHEYVEIEEHLQTPPDVARLDAVGAIAAL